MAATAAKAMTMIFLRFMKNLQMRSRCLQHGSSGELYALIVRLVQSQIDHLVSLSDTGQLVRNMLSAESEIYSHRSRHSPWVWVVFLSSRKNKSTKRGR